MKYYSLQQVLRETQKQSNYKNLIAIKLFYISNGIFIIQWVGFNYYASIHIDSDQTEADSSLFRVDA